MTMIQQNTPPRCENATLVSVIVPVYNVGKYLGRCIDSILAQTFTDFELILVDDGSTDDSGKICDEYAKHDSRIKVIHQENGGVSSARNRGLDECKGRWIAFIDSDDWVDSNYLETLLKGVEEGYEISRAEVEEITEKGVRKLSFIQEDVRVRGKEFEEYIYKFLRATDGSVVWGGLFDRKKIEESNLRFDCDLKVGEDSLFVYQYIYLLSPLSLRINTETQYHYIRMSSGLSKNFKLYLSENHVAKITTVLSKLADKYSGRNIENLSRIFLNQIFKIRKMYFTYQVPLRDAKNGLAQLRRDERFKDFFDSDDFGRLGRFVNFFFKHDMLYSYLFSVRIINSLIKI